MDPNDEQTAPLTPAGGLDADQGESEGGGRKRHRHHECVLASILHAAGVIRPRDPPADPLGGIRVQSSQIMIQVHDMGPCPTEIRLRRSAGVVSVTFDSHETFDLPFEYLRVFSPSAEVSGHGVSKLQIGKERVKVTDIEPVGSYAVRLRFDDGHDTGLYSWEALYDLGRNQTQNWEQYLKRLEGIGYQRKVCNPRKT